MNTRALLFTLSLLAVLAVTTVAGSKRREMVAGGYTAIMDLTDPHVQDIAKFVITEHNKKAGTKLEYVKVLKGASQVVAGANISLEISAKDGDKIGKYLAVVYEKPWENFRSLTSFKAV